MSSIVARSRRHHLFWRVVYAALGAPAGFAIGPAQLVTSADVEKVAGVVDMWQPRVIRDDVVLSMFGVRPRSGSDRGFVTCGVWRDAGSDGFWDRVEWRPTQIHGQRAAFNVDKGILRVDADVALIQFGWLFAVLLERLRTRNESPWR